MELLKQFPKVWLPALSRNKKIIYVSLHVVKVGGQLICQTLHAWVPVMEWGNQCTVLMYCRIECSVSSVDYNSTEIHTSWGDNVVVAGAQVSIPIRDLTSWSCQANVRRIKRSHHFVR